MHLRAAVTFLICALARPALAELHDASYGVFDAPEVFAFRRTGTVDSFMGTLSRRDDGFTITFDVGAMAGTHMGESRQHDCTFYRAHRVNGISAFTGIQQCGRGQKITTTIYDPKRGTVPANFWAEIKNGSDIAEFLLIVFTYEPKLKQQP